MYGEFDLYANNSCAEIDISKIKETEEGVYSLLKDLTDTNFGRDLDLAMQTFEAAVVVNGEINVRKLDRFIIKTLENAYD